MFVTTRMRGHLQRGLSGVLGAIVLVMLMGAHLADARGAPDTQPADTDRGSFVGVWTSGPSVAEAASLDDLGVGWARVTVDWSSVQPTSGDFVWTDLDQAMALARGSGQRRVLALVRENPTWAAAIRCTLTSDLERQNLAGFMNALATRYTGVVWQFYNEEDNTSPAADAQTDLGGCFGTVDAQGTPTVDGPVQYARTLEAVSAAVRAVDPSAELATGGVTSGNFTEYNGAFDRLFLPRVLAQLKQDNSLPSVDYVTVHYYSSQFALYMNAGTDLLGRVAQLRQDVLAAGLDPAEMKPVISDELSFTDLVGVSTSDSNDTFNLAQAAYVPKLFARSAAADVHIAFWFWMQDAAGGLGSDNTYGLKDGTGTPKPAYRAVRYFTSQIARRDQLARILDLSAVGPGMEGYEFTGVSGGSLQLVWANQVGAPAVAHEYFPVCRVTEVRDALGELSAFNAAANGVIISADPRYIFCGPSQ